MTLLYLNHLAEQLDYFSAKIWLHYFQEDSGRTGGGDDIAADMADPIWRGEITIDTRLTHAQAAEVQARIELLDGVIGRFYMYDPRLPYPIGDPTGAIINALPWAVRIAEIAGDNQRIKIKGLPDNYWLNTGDRFHTEYGSDPVHRAYHRIISRIRSDVDGNTDWVTIRPHLTDGQAVNDEIVLGKPSPLWRLASGGYEAGTGQGQLTPGGTIKMVQVL